jgi:hypothetical protein
MKWDVEGTDMFRDWFMGLGEADDDALTDVIRLLERDGPTLKRPYIGSIVQSRHHNMKELIVPHRDIRVLFVFDPRRSAILLLGGSKTNNWRRWYDRNVPIADDLYDDYLAELRAEGIL